MKIFVTGTRGIPNIMGGVETHCEELFPRIASKGVDITLIRRNNYVVSHINSFKNVKLIDINTPKNKSLEAIIHTFRAILAAKKNHADIVHIHAIGPALLTPFARILGMKVVFTHHGPDYDRDKWGFAAKLMLRLGEMMGTLYANQVIVISEVIKNLLIKKYNRKDCHLIYNGVSNPEFCDFQEFFSELGIEKGNYILGMSRFVPEKNLHHLIEAYSKIKHADCKLVIAGDSDFEDNYSTELKRKAKEKGVILTGFIKGKKLHSLLSNAKCFVLPSSHEGLPIALLEAMSYQRQVIVSNIPANLEIELDSDSYFPVGDVQTLATKIQTLIDKPYHTIKYDMSKYNWDYIAEQTLNVYQNI